MLLKFKTNKKDPQKHYWVGQVLTDIQSYRSNGMTFTPRKRVE
jgi:histidinol phosphatase-like enzyme